MTDDEVGVVWECVVPHDIDVILPPRTAVKNHTWRYCRDY